MKKTKLLLLALPLLCMAFIGKAQSEQEQRIRSSYLLAFGKDATSGEVAYWRGQGNRTLADLYSYHKDYIKRDAGTRRQAIVRSYIDALGYNPSEAEITYHAQFNRSYTELMQQHMGYVGQYISEYEKVIKRSYKTVFGRQPDSGELAYWKQQARCSYFILVSYHESYKRANQTLATGGKVINFSNLNFVTVPVSKAVALEAVKLTGLVGNDGASLVGNDGASMVAAGGGNMVAAGGGNMVAAGGGNLVAAGGGN